MKNPLLILLMVVVVVAAYFLFSQLSQKSNISSSDSISTTAPNPILVKIVPFEEGINQIASLKNASTGVVVSFKYIPFNAPNSSADVYVNNLKAGNISGVGISMPSFSPNNNYFALRSAGILGADTYTFYINVVNLTNRTILNFKPKIQSSPYLSSQYKTSFLDPYIDSYSWDGTNDIDISSYYLWPDYSDASHTIQYYRVSPEETWRYDLITGSSTLIATTP
jgi:hypothetical protein